MRDNSCGEIRTNCEGLVEEKGLLRRRECDQECGAGCGQLWVPENSLGAGAGVLGGVSPRGPVSPDPFSPPPLPTFTRLLRKPLDRSARLSEPRPEGAPGAAVGRGGAAGGGEGARRGLPGSSHRSAAGQGARTVGPGVRARPRPRLLALARPPPHRAAGAARGRGLAAAEARAAAALEAARGAERVGA